MNTSKMNVNEIEALLDRPIWQMSGREFCLLNQYANSGKSKQNPKIGKQCTGVRALAEYLGCSEATVYIMKKAGALDGAILSRIGKRIVFDGDAARNLAAEYQSNKATNNICRDEEK